MIRTARKIHRIAGYLVFLQVLLWIAGGVVFSVVPFDSLVKGGAVTSSPPTPAFPAKWMATAGDALGDIGNLIALRSHNSSQGILLEAQTESETHWLRLADGSRIEKPSAEAVTAYAAQIYTGPGKHITTRRLQEPETSVMGLVKELYGRRDVWQVSYNDKAGTRLYFDGPTGRYLTVRNDYWVLFDAMWRLHIMDYSDGENLNNWFLRLFSVLAIIFALSGTVLIIHALPRLIRQSANTGSRN